MSLEHPSLGIESIPDELKDASSQLLDPVSFRVTKDDFSHPTQPFSRN